VKGLLKRGEWRMRFGARRQAGCLVDSAKPFEAENHAYLQSGQDIYYSSTNNKNGDVASRQIAMRLHYQVSREAYYNATAFTVHPDDSTLWLRFERVFRHSNNQSPGGYASKIYWLSRKRNV